MVLGSWDIDLFPLKEAARTPGQSAADKWLSDNSDESFTEPRPVQPGDLDRLTREHRDDPNDRFFGVPTGGGGLAGGGGMHYPSEGYNQPERSYPGEPGEPGYHEPAEPGYYMPGIIHPFDDDDDYEDRNTPETYHIATRPRTSIPGVYVFDEHEHHRLGSPHEYDTDAAWEEWESDPDHWNYSSENPDAEHEIVDVHPAESHHAWHNQLASEDENFQRIAPHGLERESPSTPGHKAYRYEDPHGGTHRLWHNYLNGEYGWHTSYHNPDAEQQIPWTNHPDNSSSDSLGEALSRIDRMKTHADIMHSGTGLRPIENSYGHHYVSARPGGRVQQLLRNNGYHDEPNWGVTYYPTDGSNYTHTSHGDDLAGALAQAKRNMARG